MMKSGILGLLLLGIAYTGICQQKVVAEATVVFSVEMLDKAGKPIANEALKNTQKILYVKGNDARTEFVTTGFTQVVITDNHDSTAVLLKEAGSNKFITRMDAATWRAHNAKYLGVSYNLTNDTKVIVGYECRKVVATLKDGKTFVAYCATAIKASAVENQYQFADVPGFVLEYEAEDAKGNKIRYSAQSFSLNPVPASKFDIPAKGYRELQM